MSIRVKSFPQFSHDEQVVFAEEFAHEADLLDSDSVFAGYASSKFNTLRQNLVAAFHDTLDLIFVTLIKKQDRVNVPVSGVKHIHDPDIVPTGSVLDKVQNLWELCAWNDTVLSAIAWAQPPDGAECLLSTLPEQLTFFIRVGPSNFPG